MLRRRRRLIVKVLCWVLQRRKLEIHLGLVRIGIHRISYLVIEVDHEAFEDAFHYLLSNVESDSFIVLILCDCLNRMVILNVYWVWMELVKCLRH